jgi:hypothetical protein
MSMVLNDPLSIGSPNGRVRQAVALGDGAGCVVEWEQVGTVGTDGENADVVRSLRRKVDELAGLLMRWSEPDDALRRVVCLLEQEVRYRADLLLGRRRCEALVFPSDRAEEETAEMERLAMLDVLWGGGHPA